ncbi:MAG: hypothetical protein JSS97_01850 [Actinobacteria bacterium]|nr:hypothetical protein [Actinomycetota bacterium]
MNLPLGDRSCQDPRSGRECRATGVDSYGTDEGKGKSGSETPTETISLNFSSVEVE